MYLFARVQTKRHESVGTRKKVTDFQLLTSPLKVYIFKLFMLTYMYKYSRTYLAATQFCPTFCCREMSQAGEQSEKENHG